MKPIVRSHSTGPGSPPSGALTFLEQMLTVACYGIIAVTLGVEFNPLFLLPPPCLSRF